MHLPASLDLNVIYFDIKKAFDSVDHRILLLKLSTFGIVGNLAVF